MGWISASIDTVLTAAADPHYLSSGHLVFVRGNTLMAVPFDVTKATVMGNPIVLLEGIRRNGVFAADYSLSDTGTLVYVPGVGFNTGLSLVWVDRNGAEEAISAAPQPYRRLRVSPDGTQIAVEVEGPDNTDVWIWNLARETLTRSTVDAGADGDPIWTPDGARVVFSSARDGGGVFWKAADGTGEVERLMDAPGAKPYAWTTDGRLIFDTETAGPSDIGVLAVKGDRAVEAVLDTEFDEARPALSPDGRWLAYMSNESGQAEIYVRPFPNIDEGKWQVSTGGGIDAVWAPGGRELFYRELLVLDRVDQDPRLMRVPVDTERGFMPATPESMFRLSAYAFPSWGRKYDISPDGQRFLFLKRAGSQTGEDASPPEVIVVLNWSEELKRLLPVD